MKTHPYRVWILFVVLLVVIIGLVLYGTVGISFGWMYLIAINVVTFLLFMYDKMASRRERAGRIPNRVLFGLCVLGGAIGAWAGMRVFHHKTGPRYRRWRMVVWLSLLAYVMLSILWLF
jgi:uncharacterized membrane protein YsdA (DUF1294 family)